MTPAPRRDGEALRALIGVWLVIVSLAGAPPLYRWIGEHFPGSPSLSLACALGLAGLACTGMALMAVAGFRVILSLVAAPAQQRAPAGS